MALLEFEKAKNWRERNRYTRRQLSELTGYSESSIEEFESGRVRANLKRAVGSAAMKRYRLCLAAVANKLGNWNFETEE